MSAGPLTHKVLLTRIIAASKTKSLFCCQLFFNGQNWVQKSSILWSLRRNGHQGKAGVRCCASSPLSLCWGADALAPRQGPRRKCSWVRRLCCMCVQKTLPAERRESLSFFETLRTLWVFLQWLSKCSTEISSISTP